MLAMADHGFDGGAALKLPFDGVGHAAFLPLNVDLKLMFLRGVVALIAGVSKDAGKGCAGDRFDAGKDGLERVPVIGIARQSLGVEDELTVQRWWRY